MKDLDSIVAQEVAELLGIANENLYADIPSISARDEVFSFYVTCLTVTDICDLLSPLDCPYHKSKCFPTVLG
jgi:hypothetical protein